MFNIPPFMPLAMHFFRPPPPIIDRVTYRLPDNQYVPEEVAKSGIVLHHSVSRNISSIFSWWVEKGQRKVLRVGTAYVIDTDGTIYEFFPDTCWAWHLGHGNGTANEMRTIGIEIVSEGPLIKTEGGYRSVLGNILHYDQTMVEDLGKEWRDYQYFDKYESEQIQAVVSLINYLCDKHHIVRKVIQNLWDYDEEIKSFEGVYTHAQVRADKSDVHPHFPIAQVAYWAKLELV